MQLLVLMLDNPQRVDPVLQAWTDLGLRGIHVLESAACAEPEERGRRRGPTGLLSFAHLLAAGQYCYALLLAPAASEAQAVQAAAVAFFIMVPLRLQVLGVDLEGPILLAVFVGGTRLIQLDARITRPVARVEEREPSISLTWAIGGFAGAAVLLVVAAPFLVASAEALAEMTGLGVGFIGVALFPLVTATAELASTATAVRIGAYDLAVGNLFGSCVFQVFALALVSLVYAPGSFFSAIAPGFGLVATLGVILISVALLGTLARAELRILGVEWDALLIIALYGLGLFFLYRQGALGGLL